MNAPSLDGDSDALVAAEVERIRKHLVADIARLRSRTGWRKEGLQSL
jgi:hypothetical protein